MKALFIANAACERNESEKYENAMTVYHEMMRVTNPQDCKYQLSRGRLSMNEETSKEWDKVSGEVMLQVIRLKFQQNRHLRTRLSWFRDAKFFHEAMRTGDEDTHGRQATRADRIWGVAMEVPAALPAAAAGAAFEGCESRLGRILRHVRDEMGDDGEPWQARHWPGSDDAARDLVAKLWRAGAEAEACVQRRPWPAGWVERGQQLEKDDECPICLHPLQRSVALCRQCHRAFDLACKVTAASWDSACPICRQNSAFMVLPGAARRALDAVELGRAEGAAGMGEEWGAREAFEARMDRELSEISLDYVGGGGGGGMEDYAALADLLEIADMGAE